MSYERPVRILHFSLMITVMMQLLSEQFMQVPKPGHVIDELGALIFGFHQLSGFIVLIAAIVYLMIVLDKDEGKQRLFPWLSSEGRCALWLEIRRDIPGWFKGKLRTPDEAHAIAGCVHGMGIMLTTALGLTGSMIYLGIEPDGAMPPPIKLIREAHEIMGLAMWIFVLGHVCMAILHQIKGHQLLQAMFCKGK
ncbi:MAG: cytochrome b/b6 domain-containing protein [Mariprofundus sp.]